MLLLENLQKLSSSALKYQDLIGIAAYSVSPSTAYKVARRLDWRENKAKSARFLSIILRDYGAEVFKEVVKKENPDAYDLICLCDCHLRGWAFKTFLTSGNPDLEWDCKCDCCNHNECFHAAHTFDYDCEICDGEGDCDNCDGWPCENCACQDCQDDCNYCEYENSNCQNCDCYSCDENEDNEGEYESEGYKSNEEEIPISPPIIQEPTAQERLAKISKEITSLTGRNLKINEVDNIQGDRKQAVAYCDPKEPHIDITSGLIRDLTDDELAYVIAHETAHLEHDDETRLEDAATKYADAAVDAIEEVNEKLKKSGRGIIIRTLAGITVGAVGAAGVFVGVRANQRGHESEADEKALELMEQAGYNPQSAPEAIRKINSGYRMERTFLESITSTHPEPKSRIETLEQKAKKSKDTK